MSFGRQLSLMYNILNDFSFIYTVHILVFLNAVRWKEVAFTALELGILVNFVAWEGLKPKSSTVHFTIFQFYFCNIEVI